MLPPQLSRSSKQLGQALRRCRRLLKLSQKELGEKTRLRQSTISELEAGKPGTKLQTFFDVLTALDLEIIIQPRSKTSFPLLTLELMNEVVKKQEE